MRSLSVFIVLVFLMPITTAAMQTYTCPELVEIALEATDEACLEIGTNTACYGHSVIDAEPHPETDALVFTRPGDKEQLLDIQGLRLSAMDVGTGAWGVALMKLLAYVNNSQPEDVTFLLFGNVEIENMVEPTFTLEVTLNEAFQLRLAPVADAEVVTTVTAGEVVIAKQRLADGSWLRVEVLENGWVGWLPANVVKPANGLDELKVVEVFEPYYGPMQAFFLTTGKDDASCPEAPESGLLIQTPQGVAEVTLVINGVNIQFSDTAFVQAQPNGNMTVEVIRGWAAVETETGWQTVAPGMQSNIPMSSSLSSNGSSTLSNGATGGAIPVMTDSGIQGGQAVHQNNLPNRVEPAQAVVQQHNPVENNPATNTEVVTNPPADAVVPDNTTVQTPADGSTTSGGEEAPAQQDNLVTDLLNILTSLLQ